MKRLFLILCLITICNISYADIASVGYVDSVVAGKQDTLTAGSNIIINGNTISATDTNTTYTTGTAVSAGITKLYTGTGDAMDGAITQNAITVALSNKHDKLPMASRPSGGKYNLVWDGKTGQFIFKEYQRPDPMCYNIGFDTCIDPVIDGLDFGYRHDSTSDYSAGSKNAATYGLTTDKTWAVEFSYGIIKGITSCNDTPGSSTPTNQNFSQTDKGVYCWCKMTEPSVSLWVFSSVSSSVCADNCAYYCGYYVLYRPYVRSGVFSSVGN